MARAAGFLAAFFAGFLVDPRVVFAGFLLIGVLDSSASALLQSEKLARAPGVAKPWCGNSCPDAKFFCRIGGSANSAVSAAS
jgi:hypothetical protein